MTLTTDQKAASPKQSRSAAMLPPGMQTIAPYVALIFAAFVVYANTFDNAFLFDDDLLITMNHYLRSWDTFDKLFTATSTEGAGIAGGFFRPMQNILYFLTYQIFGQNPLGFHILNLALHAANACLALALSRKLGLSPIPAFLAILLWTVHPLHTEAITYMSGTADPLFLFFMLIALTWLAPDFKAIKLWACLPLFFLALMSKENALVFPALVIACMFLTLPEKKLNPLSYLRTFPLWLLALAYLYWRYTADYLDGPARYARLFQMQDFSNWNQYAQHPVWRIQTFFATLPNYLSLIFYPTNLRIERSFAVFAKWDYKEVLLGLLIFALAIGQLAWGHGKRGIAMSWGLLWFGATHFPNTGLLIPMNSLFLEHWMYTPALGLFLGTAQTINNGLTKWGWNKAKIVLSCLSIAAAIALGAKTLQQNTVWYNPFTLYGHIFANGERSPRGHNNLAIAYQKNHQIPEAIEELRKAIKEGDTYAETHHNLALALLTQPNGVSHKEESIKECLKALEIEPRFYRSHLLLAQIYAIMNKEQESKQELQKAKDIMQQMGLSQ